MMKVCIIFILLSLLVSFKTQNIYFGFIIGILVGQASFKLLILAFGISHEKQQTNFVFILMSIVKFGVFVILAFALFKGGMSIYEIVAGLFLSQVAVTISFAYNIIFLNK